MGQKPRPPPPPINRFARGSAGSLSAAFGSFSLGNADIFGYVSDATADYFGLSFGTFIINDFGAKGVDYDRVTTDFNADFKYAASPTPTPVALGAINSTTVLPQVADLPSPAADGKYYYCSQKRGITCTYEVNADSGFRFVSLSEGLLGAGGGEASPFRPMSAPGRGSALGSVSGVLP